MRAWTDGERHILLDHEGLHVWTEDSVESYAQFALANKKTDGALAVGNQGKEVWVQSPDGATARIDLGENEVEEHDWTLLDASYTRRRLLVAQAFEDDEDPRGWSARVGFFNYEIKKFDTLELPEPTTVEWPGLIWGDAPWEGKALGFASAKGKRPDSDAFRFTTNRHGVALSDRDSGIVAVVPNRRETFQWAIRLPSEKKLQVFAVPTRKGALVSVATTNGESALIHFDDTGRVLGSRAFWNLGPSVLLDPGRILVPASETYGKGRLVLRVVSLDTMADVRILEGDVDGKGSMTTDVAADLRSFVFGVAGKFWRGVLESGSWRLESDLIAVREMRAKARAEAAKTADDEEEEERYRPEYVEDGEHAVDFAVIDEAPPAWNATNGKSFEFSFKLRSSGVEGDGLVIELSGDAVTSELADFETAEIEGVAGAFERDGNRWVVTIPATLPPGLKYPYVPEPAKKERPEAREWMETTQFSVTVRGKAKASGSELLRVEARSTAQEETIRWMRPLSVK
jgi:hypothetical protein